MCTATSSPPDLCLSSCLFWSVVWHRRQRFTFSDAACILKLQNFIRPISPVSRESFAAQSSNSLRLSLCCFTFPQSTKAPGTNFCQDANFLRWCSSGTCLLNASVCQLCRLLGQEPSFLYTYSDTEPKMNLSVVSIFLFSSSTGEAAALASGNVPREQFLACWPSLVRALLSKSLSTSRGKVSAYHFLDFFLLS